MTLKEVLLLLFIPWAVYITREYSILKSKVNESAITDKHIYEELGSFKEMLKDMKISQKEMKAEIDSDLKALSGKLDQLLIEEYKFFKRVMGNDNGPGK